MNGRRQTQTLKVPLIIVEGVENIQGPPVVASSDTMYVPQLWV